MRRKESVHNLCCGALVCPEAGEEGANPAPFLSYMHMYVIDKTNQTRSGQTFAVDLGFTPGFLHRPSREIRKTWWP